MLSVNIGFRWRLSVSNFLLYFNTHISILFSVTLWFKWVWLFLLFPIPESSWGFLKASQCSDDWFHCHHVTQGVSIFDKKKPFFYLLFTFLQVLWSDRKAESMILHVFFFLFTSYTCRLVSSSHKQWTSCKY